MYNTTIQENSVGKVFIVPIEKTGIYNSDPGVSIKYKITSGDIENFSRLKQKRLEICVPYDQNWDKQCLCFEPREKRELSADSQGNLS